MVPYLVSLTAVKVNNWVVKASVFDDQILLFCWNEAKMDTYTVIFYSEEHALDFMERLHNE